MKKGHSVKLKKKKLSKGEKKIILEVYVHGAPKIKTLNIYLDANALNSFENKHSKHKKREEPLSNANKVSEIKNHVPDLVKIKPSNIKFLDHFKSLKDKKKGNLMGYANRDSTHKIAAKYFDSKDFKENGLADKELEDIQSRFFKWLKKQK